MRRLTEVELDEIPAHYIEYIPSDKHQKVGKLDIDRSKKLYEYITIRNILRRAGVLLAGLKQQADRLWDKFHKKQVEAEPMFTVTFKATATREKMIALREWMKAEGVRHE